MLSTCKTNSFSYSIAIVRFLEEICRVNSTPAAAWNFCRFLPPNKPEAEGIFLIITEEREREVFQPKKTPKIFFRFDRAEIFVLMREIPFQKNLFGWGNTFIMQQAAFASAAVFTTDPKRHKSPPSTPLYTTLALYTLQAEAKMAKKRL